MYRLKPEFIKLNEVERLYKLKVPVIGLTGGIASGKSTVAKKLATKNFPIIGADLLVHQIYGLDSSLDFIKANFKNAITDGKIDFKALRKIFFADQSAQERIEEFIYSQLEAEFQKAASNFSDHDFLIYDVPLLFEKGLTTLVDISVCVYCDRPTQVSRIMKRDNVDEALAQSMLKKQINIDDKKQMADWVIGNNESLDNLDIELTRFLDHYFTK